MAMQSCIVERSLSKGIDIINEFLARCTLNQISNNVFMTLSSRSEKRSLKSLICSWKEGFPYLM